MKNTTFELVIKDIGLLNSIQKNYIEKHEVILNHDEVEIEVSAVGLNFMNLMSAMGLYPGYENGFKSLAVEFCGKITKKGTSVTAYNIGDIVFGISENSGKQHIVVNVNFIQKKPINLSDIEAAATPITYLTSFIGICKLGKLKENESILIHSASGGVGLAAIEFAKYKGANIFLTAGTEIKREFLRNLGFTAVSDSRSLIFADEIRKTSKNGMDVIFNSLSGSLSEKNFELLDVLGRIVDISKSEVYSNKSVPYVNFKKCNSYTFLDLDYLAANNSSFVNESFKEINHLLTNNKIEAPKLISVFSTDEFPKALRLMSKEKHIGKIVIKY